MRYKKLMANYLDKNNVLSFAKDGKIILGIDDNITDEAISLAYKNDIEISKMSLIKPKAVERVVVTVIGKDSTGIIADVSSICKEYSVNILDINQTVLHGDIFTMAMVVDICNASIDIENFHIKLVELGKSRDLKINVHHEDLFNFMHRI